MDWSGTCRRGEGITTVNCGKLKKPQQQICAEARRLQFRLQKWYGAQGAAHHSIAKTSPTAAGSSSSTSSNMGSLGSSEKLQVWVHDWSASEGGEREKIRPSPLRAQPGRLISRTTATTARATTSSSDGEKRAECSIAQACVAK